MASELHCDPCDLESKTVTAARYCSDCEEHLCKDCAKSHTRFKVFRSHHIIDFKSLKSKLPTPSKNCDIHPDMLLDFFCTQHDISCCRGCIADTHRSCDKILPLDVASKDIKKSSLLLDSLSLITDKIATLEKLFKNREDNLNSLKKTESKIIQQIGKAKSKLIKQLDKLEEKLIAEVSTIHIKSENEICEQKHNLSKMQVEYNQHKESLEVLKQYGANTQLFLYLRETMISMKNTEDKVIRLSSLFTEIDIEFHETENIEKNLIGSVSEIKRPCKVEYKPGVLQQAQTKAYIIKSLAELEVGGSVKLKSGEYSFITDMTSTHDNSLLLCNWRLDNPRVYMYKNCQNYYKEITCSSPPFGISVIPGTDKAVVTLPSEKSIQYINTTDLKIGGKVKIGMEGYGVTVKRENIFVGGNGVFKILDRNGSDIKTIKVGVSNIESLDYDEENANVIYRSAGSLICCKVDGTVLYQYEAPGYRGVAVDRQGNVYVSMSDTDEIHRLSSDGKFRDSVSTANSTGVFTFNCDYSKLFVVTSGMPKVITIFKCK